MESFRGHGIRYERADKAKSELYLTSIPVVNSGTVELLDNRQLVEQFRRLERRRGRTGKDTIDHPPRLFDDMANSVAGVIYLVLNEPGSGSGFNPARHVLREPISPIPSVPICLGQTLNPYPATVLAQVLQGSVCVLGAFVTEYSGLRRHLEDVKYWLATNAPWALSDHRLLLGAYEESHHEEQWELIELIEQVLGGFWEPGPASWEVRREAMLGIIHKATSFTFEPVLRIGADVKLLPEALSRPFDHEEKTVLGAVLQAFGLLVTRIQPEPQEPEPIKVETDFDVFKDW